MKVLRIAVSAAAILAACASNKPQPEPPVAQQQPAPPPAAPKAVVEAPPPAAPAPVVQAPRPEVAPLSIYFDFDKSELKDPARGTLSHLTIDLPKDARIRVEGNCDERGTSEYNIALGQRRADAAKKYLVNLGIDAANIETISYGKEKPKALGHDEASWQENRRDDIFIKLPQVVGLR
ncbi:MAG TPA: OmpA family protein [Myxococcales bacterium]|nr:OmpA family protein [Myxococcales bacterium]